MWSKGHAALCLRACGHRHGGSGDIMVLVCHMILDDYVIKRVMWLNGWELLIVSHDPAKFDGQWYCGSGDIMVLVFLMKESGNFVGISPSRQVTILPSFVAIGTLAVEIWFKCVTWSYKTGWVTLWVGGPQVKSPSYQVWWP